MFTVRNITVGESLGRIAAELPPSVEVFLEHDFDFCCGGKQTLGEACDKAGIDPEQVLAEIERKLTRGVEPPESWNRRSLDELVDAILRTFHKPLREMLPHLDTLAIRVEAAHGPVRGPYLSELREIVQLLIDDLGRHMDEEERLLFPEIRRNEGPLSQDAVRSLEDDHRSVAKALARIRALTSDFTLPEDACNTWRALWHGLQRMEVDLKEHIHLENNVLFPRALDELGRVA
ncbi:MAG: Iron-sulfur cluster repair protein YtfE [Calditrichaeota bacterium]|nr:Iron-sulfur cluster repair protein YtfE [Calditrichota bacterium]